MRERKHPIILGLSPSRHAGHAPRAREPAATLVAWTYSHASSPPDATAADFVRAALIGTSAPLASAARLSPSTSTSTIVVTFTAWGDVSDYTATVIDAMRAVFASEAGVAPADVTITVTPASVNIHVAISVPAATASSTATALSAGIFASEAALEAALVSGGVTGVTVATITIVSCGSASTRASIRIGSGSRWGGTMTGCCFVWFAIFDVGFVMRGFASWDRGLRISDFAICDLRF